MKLNRPVQRRVTARQARKGAAASGQFSQIVGRLDLGLEFVTCLFVANESSVGSQDGPKPGVRKMQPRWAFRQDFKRKMYLFYIHVSAEVVIVWFATELILIEISA